MKLVFMQGFVNKLKIFYLEEGLDKVYNEIIVNAGLPFDIIMKSIDDITQGKKVKTVALVGNTSCLKQLEEHYSKEEGVNIVWL